MLLNAHIMYMLALLVLIEVNSGDCSASKEIRTRLPSPIGQPYYTIGVGPTCYNYPLNKTTPFQLQARYHDKIVKRFFFNNDYRGSIFRYLKQYQYSHVDVCEGYESLLKFLVEILLNHKYTITRDPSIKARRKITEWKYQSKILMIFAFLADEMFIRLAEILSQTDILVMNLHTNAISPKLLHSAKQIRECFQGDKTLSPRHNNGFKLAIHNFNNTSR